MTPRMTYNSPLPPPTSHLPFPNLRHLLGPSSSCCVQGPSPAYLQPPRHHHHSSPFTLVAREYLYAIGISIHCRNIGEDATPTHQLLLAADTHPSNTYGFNHSHPLRFPSTLSPSDTSYPLLRIGTPTLDLDMDN